MLAAGVPYTIARSTKRTDLLAVLGVLGCVNLEIPVVRGSWAAVMARMNPGGEKNMGTLFVVGTPIGNLEDLTARSARVLGQVDLVAAEDTRVTRRLLNHLGIKVRVTSYHQHNRLRRIPALLEALAVGDVALVTDAGMPGVSDPGAELVAQASANGFAVDVAPGVSSVTTAVAVSGLNSDSFLFLGFLPRQAKRRRERLESVANAVDTLVIMEAPHRVAATLADLLTVLGDRPVAVCRELTKLHQEVFRGALSQAKDHFTTPRGEFVVVVAGADGGDSGSTGSRRTPQEGTVEEAISRLAELRQAGAAPQEAIAAVSEATGRSRNDLYRLWLQLP